VEIGSGVADKCRNSKMQRLSAFTGCASPFAKLQITLLGVGICLTSRSSMAVARPRSDNFSGWFGSDNNPESIPSSQALQPPCFHTLSPKSGYDCVRILSRSWLCRHRLTRTNSAHMIRNSRKVGGAALHPWCCTGLDSPGCEGCVVGMKIHR
jgi:hypothetical protein